MDKKQYLLEAIQAGAYKHKEWLMRCFSVTHEIPFGGGRDDYPYRIVRSNEDTERLYFLDPQSPMGKTPIEGSIISEPMFAFKERIVLQPNDLPNVKEVTDTLLGNVIVNLYTLVYPFGDRFPFMTGKITGGRLTKFIVAHLTDPPKPGEPRNPQGIYHDDYERWCEGVDALAGLAPICVPSGSARSLVIDPIVTQRRKELFEKYKDQLNDLAVLAQIDKELSDLDRSTFKGDPSEGFYVSGKAFPVNRKKLFISYGLEKGMGIGKDVFIPKPLADGWDLNNFPAMVESSRSASHSRGHQTQLGGAEVKNDYRRFQNVKVVMEDCRTKEGLVKLITPWKVDRMVGLYGYDPKSDTTYLLTKEHLEKHVGRYIMVRSPVTCKAPAPSFCARCVGDNIARLPQGIHITTSGIGSVFMNTFMKAMHGKVNSTAQYSFKHSIT